MESKRIELYNRFKTDAQDHGKSDVFRKKYSGYPAWDDVNFSDETKAKGIWAKTIEIFERIELKEFIKTYACDKDWAKNLEYCKTSPKQGEWSNLEDGNKTKFLQEFPCVASLIRGPGRQMNSNEGMIFALPITYDGDRCWIYMSENSQGDSKWDGLIKNLVNGKKGKFECEGGEISSDNDNP